MRFNCPGTVFIYLFIGAFGKRMQFLQNNLPSTYAINKHNFKIKSLLAFNTRIQNSLAYFC